MSEMQHYINHVVLVVDRSGSMSHLSKKVVDVFDYELNNLKRRSVELKQETRISIYLFSHEVECLVYDMDVMRFESLKNYYRIGGNTALMDATGLAVEEMKRLPEIHGDHAFLLYVLTDGEENDSRRVNMSSLRNTLNQLPDNWTTVCLVPDLHGVAEAKKFGFPPANVQIWSTDERGVESVGKEFRSAMDSYMTMRSTGVRGTKNFFSLDLSALKSSDVTNALTEINPRDFMLLPVFKTEEIRSFVEGCGVNYVIGDAFYELMKTETIQDHKDIFVQNRHSGKVYGGTQARGILGLPRYTVRVNPKSHDNWKIFVQSTSVNRKLIPGTCLLVRKRS